MAVRDIVLETGRERIGNYPIGVTCPVEGFYLWFLNKANAGDYVKLIIQLVTETELSRRPEFDDMINVLVLYRPLPAYLAEAKNETELRCLLLDLLHNTIRSEGMRRGWDLAPFNKAFESARPCVISQVVRACGPKWNPSRKLNAEVILEWTSTAACFYIVVRTREGIKVLEEVVAEAGPSSLEIAKILGRLLWKDNNTVALRARGNNKERTVTVREET